MKISDLINLTALIVIPPFAVLLGRWLQNLAEQRKDKMQIFKVLMTRFRNKYIAHKDNEPVPVPMLDGAMQAMFEFDEKVWELYDLDGYAGLKDCFETYMIRIQDLMGIEERE